MSFKDKGKVLSSKGLRDTDGTFYYKFNSPTELYFIFQHIASHASKIHSYSTFLPSKTDSTLKQQL